MNVNSIVNMVVRMVMRMVMQKGISAGVDKFAKRKGKSAQAGQGDAAQRDGQGGDYNDPEMNKRTRQSLRVGRRMGKF
ncbi:hypothetical protein [Sediminimonas sp.]|uniref:hypothetical protein n=1 Tax=Sediminimonas sp. TaxID=2823379 RepID=UPI0025EA2F7F|nr:hypothetical protein [Sediminimonas sp.]